MSFHPQIQPNRGCSLFQTKKLLVGYCKNLCFDGWQPHQLKLIKKQRSLNNGNNKIKINAVNFDPSIPRIIDPTSLPRIIDPTQIPRLFNSEIVPQNTIPYAAFVGISILILIVADISFYFRKWASETDTSVINNNNTENDRKKLIQNQSLKLNSNSDIMDDSLNVDEQLLVGGQNEKIVQGNKIASERNRGLWWLVICTLVSLYLLPLLNQEEALRP